MAALTLEAVYRALKRGEVAPVYYLTGEAEVLKDELIAAITQSAVDPARRDFNLDTRSAGDLDGEALHALVETPPMLAERRAVVVRGLEQWRANGAVWQVLLRYLGRPSSATVLVLTHGAGEKPHAQVAAAALHVQIDALSPELLRRWLAARAQRLGITFEPDAAEHLITAVGVDLGSLAMEVEKLAATAPAGQPMTVALVSQLVGVRRGETLSDWVDAALRRDTATAVALLDVVLPQPGVTGVRMGIALGTALLGTRVARALADRGSSAREVGDELYRSLRQTRPSGVGLWSEEAKRWARAAATWSPDELDRALQTLYEADRSLKSTTLSDERAVLASVLLQLGRRRAAA